MSSTFPSRAAFDGTRQRVRGAPGITILELLVAGSSIALLMFLLLPAVWEARETSRNLQCTDRLHRIGAALHTFEETHGALPAGWILEPSGKSSYGWGTAILPQLDEDALSRQINRNGPIDEVNRAVRATTPAAFLCPSDHGEPEFPLFAETGEPGANAQQSTVLLVTLPRANYMGVFGTTEPDEVAGNSGDGLFIEGRGFRFDEISRGSSRVMLVGERTTRKLASTWLGMMTAGEDAGGRIVGCAFLGPNREAIDECEFDSRHFGHVNFVWADGHVTSIPNDIDPQVYRTCAQRR